MQMRFKNSMWKKEQEQVQEDEEEEGEEEEREGERKEEEEEQEEEEEDAVWRIDNWFGPYTLMICFGPASSVW